MLHSAQDAQQRREYAIKVAAMEMAMTKDIVVQWAMDLAVNIVASVLATAIGKITLTCISSTFHVNWNMKSKLVQQSPSTQLVSQN